jgi:2-phosphosulfolactate phosphatase
MDVAWLPGEKNPHPGEWDVFVVDVLRASTTVITALSNGAREIMPAASIAEARRSAGNQKKDAVLLCGERAGFRIRGFDLGNSPSDYSKERVLGKSLVFASTNGSVMLKKAAGKGGRVFVAGFVNMDAVVQAISSRDKDTRIACSGREGGFSLEDAVCAGMIVDRVRNMGVDPECWDGALSALLLYRHFASDLAGMARNSFHGKYLASIGMDKDIPDCTAVSRYNIVPEMRKGRITAKQP